jgi:hypothetical protein
VGVFDEGVLFADAVQVASEGGVIRDACESYFLARALGAHAALDAGEVVACVGDGM